jgi:hypothetical protein
MIGASNAIALIDPMKIVLRFIYPAGIPGAVACAQCWVQSRLLVFAGRHSTGICIKAVLVYLV